MKSILSLFALCLLITTTSVAQVGIGIETPDPSSVLDLESTTAGLLAPRMTTAQRDAIALPAKSLIVFNTTTNSLQINTGTSAAPVWGSFAPVDATKPVVPPSVTTTQMNAIVAPAIGSLVFNTTENCVFQYEAATPTNKWQSLCEAKSSKIVTMYRNLNGVANTITTSNGGSTFTAFPLNSAHVTEIDSDYFTVLGNGRIQVLKAGSYAISASWAVQNLRSGSSKYIFAVFRGATRLGYIARGFASLPSSDYFGASGIFQYNFNANDIIDVQYLIDNGAANLEGDLLHIGIVKL